MEHALFQDGTVPNEISTREQIPGNQPKKIEKNGNYQVVIERNLFGTSADSAEKTNKKKDPLEGLKPTSLDVVLMGTAIGVHEEKSAVILEKGKRKQELYHVGDSVKGAIIKDILRGKVIIDYNNRDEILDMSEADKYRSQPTGTVSNYSRFVSRPQTGSVQSTPPIIRTKIVPPMRRFSGKVISGTPSKRN